MCKEEGLVYLIHTPVGGKYGGYFTGIARQDGYFNADSLLGDYPVAWHFTDSNGCSNADTIILSVVEPVITIDKSNTVACKNKNFPLKAQVENAAGLYWMKGNSSDGYFTGSQAGNTATYQHGINDLANRGFWIRVKSTDPVCATMFDSVYIQVGDVPVVNFSSDTTSGHAPFKVRFYDSSTIVFNSIAQWQWDFGDGSTSVIQNPIYTYKKDGYYDVLLRVISNLGCYDSLIKTAFIHAIPTGVESTESPGIRVYPNPSSGDIFIRSMQLMASVSIYDATGKKVYHVQDLNTKEYTLRFRQAGSYFITIGLVDGGVVVRKLVLE